MFSLDINNEKTELAKTFVATLIELMKTDDKIIALDADLGSASGLEKIKKTNPDRFIDVGIAEANMTGIAAGLSAVGFIPFIHSFAPFVSRRNYDQLYMAGAYAHNTVNIFGSDPGFAVGPNGGTHTSFEDVALMREIPEAIVCDASDAVLLEWIVKTFAKLKGIHYVRANRKGVRNIYKKGSTFEIGKANVLNEGKDILIVCAGQLVSDALDACKILADKNVSAQVVDMFCIKPLDAETLLKCAVGKKAVMSFENHSIVGGLGSAVAEVLAENAVGVKFKRIGVNDRFGEVGSQEYLQKTFGLTAQNLVEQALTLLGKN